MLPFVIKGTVKMIKNIILDMGNVLLEYNPKKILDAVCATQEGKDIILKELFHGEEWILGDKGEIINSQRFDGAAQRVPVKYHKELRTCVDTWTDYMLPIPGARDFCLWAKGQGYHLFVLSNACGKFHDYFPKQYPPEWFDGVVVSSDIHMIKPDAGIYQYILEKYHLIAQESLFVDDMEYNVEGAKAVGLHAEVFHNDFESIKNQILTL